MFGRRLVLLITALIVIGGGCTDKTVLLAPKLVPVNPQAQIVPPSLINATLPITSSTDPRYVLALPTYDDTVLVTVRIDGVIHVDTARNTPIQPYQGDLDGSGEGVAGVYDQCAANVLFVYDVGRTGPLPCLMYPVPQPFWVDTLLVKGHGSVSRGPGVPEYPGTCDGPCHTYSKQQTVSITPLPALLQISASSLTHVAGGTVTFRGSVSPDSIHHIAVPLKTMSWAWTPLGGNGNTVACATPVNPCTTPVLEDGSMRVTALANGEEQFVSVGVSIVNWAPPGPCPGAVLNPPQPKSSVYGHARPQIGENYPHTGDDYDAVAGTDILSPRAGTISAMRTSRTAGKMMIITSDTRYSWLMHMLSFEPGLHVGSPVQVGTKLGKVGSTGHSTGAHLHFEEHTKDGPMTIESGERKGKAPWETLVPPCTF